ncbi:hypothetical protein HK097_001702 [Rhizophlyctis rosea]|uniref:t-SNARE coiled-coil homology domain-containing protein n=1 Tax=Rhizophlyctis rosea TaxID=64517 RepID=A0AAD5X1Q0_9FUNG|nr:hypothetical protein HK097_001702 [Rhizophlyctis rosea]
MATRSRTLLFLQYRNTFSRTGGIRQARPPGVDTSERAGLIANEVNQGTEVVVEMGVLPPRWIDIVDEVDEEVERIREKSEHAVNELDALHKKNLLPGFDDQLKDEHSIERLTEKVTQMFRDAERKVKRVEQLSKQSSRNSQQNQTLAKNIQISLATKLQDLSQQFRKTQSSYLQKLRGRETRNKQDLFMMEQESAEDEALDAVFTDAQLAQVQNNERAITQREKEINDIVKSLLGVADIFKELQTMVIDQGTVLDRIDYNIETTTVHVQEAHAQLKKVSGTLPG